MNLFDKHIITNRWYEYKAGILSSLWRKFRDRNKPKTPFLIRGRIIIKGEPSIKNDETGQKIKDLIT